MSTVSAYKKGNWRRICDFCGCWFNRSELRRVGEFVICKDEGPERTRTQLAKASARQRQIKVLPVPDPKPIDVSNPDILGSEEGIIVEFLSRMIAATSRYELIDSGAAPIPSSPSATDALPACAWGGRYLYSLIVENKRPVTVVTQAKAALKAAADYLALFSQTSSTADPIYGSIFVGAIIDTDTVIQGGLTLLYAYRVFGTASYLTLATAAAWYLRNLQAIGSHATSHFTSRDAAGTSRLYTGGLASQVNTNGTFDCDHRFYPSSLMALEFWNALKTTSGDILVGANTTAGGEFTSAPQQPLSQCISDLRSCFVTGITDATGTTLTGLSSSTPREFFNAYPATKANFPAVTGTGMWEYVDGGAAGGTSITSQTVAKALCGLYAVDGSTSQVTSVIDWLQSFTSNPNLEAGSMTNQQVMHSTNGTYYPTETISTSLQVRDGATFAPLKTNASAIYDWAALGLMAGPLSARYQSSFRDARLIPLGRRRRYADGLPSDWVLDSIALRGRSGLALQTGFMEQVTPGNHIINDAVGAAQFGLALRVAPTVRPVQAT